MSIFSTDGSENNTPVFVCGALIPGFLYLVVGNLVGAPAFRVEAHDDPPPLGEEWEDVVEVSYLPSSADVFLVEWCATWPDENERPDAIVRQTSAAAAYAT